MRLELAVITILVGSAQDVSSFAHTNICKRATPGTSINIGSPLARQHDYLPLKHLNYASNATDYTMVEDVKLPYKMPSLESIQQSIAGPSYEMNTGTNTIKVTKESYNIKELGLQVAANVVPRPTLDDVKGNRGPLSRLGFVAASFFGAYSAMFVYLLNHVLTQMSTSLYSNVGINTLALFSAAFFWDNFILSTGSFFFRSITRPNNKFKFKVLEALSYPRFIAHALLTPFLLKSSAELGKMAGIPFFNRPVAQVGAMVIASTIAVLSTINVVKGGITIDTNPRKCIKGEMTFFKHGENSFFHVLPSLLVTFVNLFIGLSVKSAGKTAMGNWMLIGSGAILSLFVPLFGSGVTKISGNFSEVILILSYVQASVAAAL